MNLSKSTYCTGIQCPKILWMDRNRPEQFDTSVQNSRQLEIARQVSELATGYFGEYAKVAHSPNASEMIAHTRQLMASGASVIADASFAFGNLFCTVDILRVFDDHVEIVEIKSSAGKPRGKVKNIHMHDMAYQYYVLTNCGLNVQKVSLLYLNSKYVRQGELDFGQLFIFINCTREVLRKQKKIPEMIERITHIALAETEPEMTAARCCDKPFPCGYKSWCRRHLPEHNILNIGWSMGGNVLEKAYQAGLLHFEDILNAEIKLSKQQRRQVETVVHDLPPHIDKPAVRQFLDGLQYPIYHLDFESFLQPVPLWDGVRPYMLMPFQYSLHIQQEDGALEHKEYLAQEGKDPRRAIAERLCADIPADACTLAYYMAFEISQLKLLAEAFPDLSDHLLSIAENMRDLSEPFRRGDYYCKEMGGTYSIKTVLPALCPNEPELDYKKLDLIRHGSDAMDAFATLHEKPPDEIERIRKALLAYCKLDTLAMVRILGRLSQMVGSLEGVV